MIEGTLQNLSFPDVLQVIATGQKTGVLSVEQGERRARLLFTRGRLLSAQLEPGLHLGELLIRMDLLTTLEVQELLTRQRQTPQVHLGQLARAADLVTADELRAALRAQATDALTELCGWRRGSFAFRDEDFAAEEGEPMDALALLMEAAQRLQDWEQGAVPPESIFVRAGDPTQVELPRGAWEVLGYVSGRRNAASIAAELDLPERQVYRLLYQLEELGVIARLPEAREGAVLVVARDDAQRRLIQLSLRRAGLSTLLASSLEEGLASLHRDRPRVVVVDDAAGEGWRLLRALQRSAKRAHLPAILLARSAPGGLLRRFARTQAHVLSKPFGELELQQLAARLAGRSLG